jgi:hypothetical protein
VRETRLGMDVIALSQSDWLMFVLAVCKPTLIGMVLLHRG